MRIILHMLALSSHACFHLATAAAAARRAALALPVIIVMPDDTAAFGAKLYRTPSGDMRWVQQQPLLLGIWAILVHTHSKLFPESSVPVPCLQNLLTVYTPRSSGRAAGAA